MLLLRKLGGEMRAWSVGPQVGGNCRFERSLGRWTGVHGWNDIGVV
jgi:hypothetical protein